MKNMKIVLTIIALLISSTLFAQSRVEIVNVDPSNYPEIKAEVKVFNQNGEDARDVLRADNFVISDGDELRPVKSLLCDNNRRKISLILTIDRSLSMTTRRDEFGNRSGKDLALNVARNFIDQFNPTDGEFGITYFSAGGVDPAGITHEFSTDKESLKNSLNTINFVQATDYNKAFFGQPSINKEGIFGLASRARYSTFVIYITDGRHSEGQIQSGAIADSANKIGMRVYPISLGLPLPDELLQISSATGGTVGDNFTTDQQFEDFYQQLLVNATQIANPAPCELVWDTDCSGGDLTLTYNDFGNPSKDTVYTIPTDLLPFLEFQPNLEFLNQGWNTNASIPFTVTARNNAVDLNGFTSSDPRFTVTGNLNRTLAKDETADLNLVLNTPDRECIAGDVVIEGSACQKTVDVKADFIFANEVNVGGSTIEEEISYPASQTFCNYSDQPLQVTDIRIFGGNASDNFSISNSTNRQQTIPPCSCIDIEFDFTPNVVGERTSEYILVTNRGEFKAQITGTGGGQAQIAATSPTIPSVNCENPTDEFTIDISNDGEIDLNITGMSINPATDFTIVTPATPFIVDKDGGTQTVTIRFAPNDPSLFGTRTADLIINNDSQNDQNLTIPLEGVVRNVGVMADKSEIDFGVLCPGEAVSEDVTISNAGGSQGEFTVGLSVNNNYYTLSDASFFLANNDNRATTVSFQTVDVGTYDGTYTITDACGNSVDVTLKAIVDLPELTIVNGDDLTSNIGESTQSDLEVQNTSQHTLQINGGFISDPQVTFVNDLSANPIQVAPGATVLIPLAYLPTANVEITPTITLNTDKCDYDFIGSLRATPGSIPADLTLNNSEAFIGQTFDMELLFHNKTQGFEVLATNSIDFKLLYDSRYLEFISSAGGVANAVDDGNNTTTLTVTDYPIDNNAIDNISLRFKALSGVLGQNSITILVRDGNATGFTIRENPGDFTLRKANANLDIQDKTVRTGDVISFPIYVDDEGDNLKAFHEGLKGEVIYNPLVLAPIGNNYDITYSTDLSVATLTFQSQIDFDSPTVQKGTGIQVVESFLVESIDFKILYGNQNISPVTVRNVKSLISDDAVTIRDSIANINITDLCEYENGEYRLIESGASNPLGTSILYANSNTLEIDLTTVEQTAHTLVIFSSSGQVVLTEKGFQSPGKHKLYLTGLDLAPGAYYISFSGMTHTVQNNFMIID